MKNYYTIDYCGKVKEISKQIAKKLLNADRDFIIWYEDSNNVFISDCANNKKIIVAAVVEITGKFKAEYYEAGDF